MTLRSILDDLHISESELKALLGHSKANLPQCSELVVDGVGVGYFANTTGYILKVESIVVMNSNRATSAAALNLDGLVAGNGAVLAARTSESSGFADAACEVIKNGIPINMQNNSHIVIQDTQYQALDICRMWLTYTLLEA